jgi:putative glutamine amidotransferase
VAGRPVVGVTGYQVGPVAAEQAGFGSRELAVYPMAYFRWLAGLGMVPVPVTQSIDIEDSLDLVDGIVLSGGNDIDPAHYGAQRHPTVTDICPERDEFELALAKVALARGVPVLGICRGLQILNIALGGTLHQHLPDLPGTLAHSPEWLDGTTRDPSNRWAVSVHDVEVSHPWLVRLTTCRRFETNTYHHQAADRIGDGLVAAARSRDGVVEALVGTEFPVLGVQWHPELHQLGDAAGEAPFRWLTNRLTSRLAA